ncbi:MAG: hypothetical protein AB1798_06930 [Spirochaetota bacterium]
MKTQGGSLSLKNGSTIVIIGAGPAGTFFADFALDIVRSKGLNISIILFDGKDFTKSGPKGCNLCAGVISETLVERLKARGIVLPGEKVQRKISGYYIHGRAGSFLLSHPQNESRITTVFRGNGPRQSGRETNVSFDDYLLEHVRNKGLQLIRKSVKRVELPQDPKAPIRVIYGTGDEETVLESDLVVGAFGLSGSMMKKMQDLRFGYRPPDTIRARNMEIRLGGDFIHKYFSDNIFTYNLSTAKGMRVVSIIPKKEYITVNMIGKKDVKSEELASFLDRLVLRGQLPKNSDWSKSFCGCSPKVATTAAEKPFTNRLVIIGDASCSRYYKNGIESAFITARLAARAAFAWGISDSAFNTGYFKRVKKIIVKDNFYGRILFKINDLVSGSTFLSEVLIKALTNENRYSEMKDIRDVLWNMYTGNIPYKRIFLKFINPALQWELTFTTLQLILTKMVSKLSSLFHREKRKKVQ